MTDTTTSNRPLRVFLCHASGDKPAVRDLYRRLKADGFAPWLDEEDLLPGQDWQTEIPKAVRASDVILVCLSQHAITKAGYVQKEIKSALDVSDEQPDGVIFLIPLKLEECEVPERLSRWQWVNQFESNGYERLVRSLRTRARELGARAEPLPFPPPPLSAKRKADEMLVRHVDEWKLKVSDVVVFERELQNFARNYRENGLIAIDIGVWSKSLFDSRYIDETGYPIEPDAGRSWGVKFIWQSKINEWQQVSDMGVQFTVAVIGGDFPLLLKIGAVMDTARPFVLAFVERCKTLWNATSIVIPTPGVMVKTAPESHTSSISGGVNVDANTVTVGNDVVGRDKIIQAGTYIEHATIIQSGTSVSETEPSVEVPPPVVNVLRLREEEVLPGVAWLSDPRNLRVIGDMEFVRVPAGRFIMGSDHHSDNEKPEHIVEIPYEYWMGRYPVTNEQFAKFVAEAKYKFDQGNSEKEADHPVVNVNWHWAMAYCKWLNDRSRGELKDLVLRLPTEAEWEKAARGEQGNQWPWGNVWDARKCNMEESGKGTITSVSAYSPQGDSPYGCADMMGNSCDWTLSKKRAYPYKAGDGRNEIDSNNPWRVLRGASWNIPSKYACCAYRYDIPLDNNFGASGLRCCVGPGSRF
jgi:formylglycine-generating enzyme required for sulfatase activity